MKKRLIGAKEIEVVRSNSKKYIACVRIYSIFGCDLNQKFLLHLFIYTFNVDTCIYFHDVYQMIE